MLRRQWVSLSLALFQVEQIKMTESVNLGLLAAEDAEGKRAWQRAPAEADGCLSSDELHDHFGESPVWDGSLPLSHGILLHAGVHGRANLPFAGEGRCTRGGAVPLSHVAEHRGGAVRGQECLRTEEVPRAF